MFVNWLLIQRTWLSFIFFPKQFANQQIRNQPCYVYYIFIFQFCQKVLIECFAFPAGKRRQNNVVVTSLQRPCNVVITSCDGWLKLNCLERKRKIILSRKMTGFAIIIKYNYLHPLWQINWRILLNMKFRLNHSFKMSFIEIHRIQPLLSVILHNCLITSANQSNQINSEAGPCPTRCYNVLF